MRKLSVRNEADEFKIKKLKQGVQLPLFLEGVIQKGVEERVEMRKTPFSALIIYLPYPKLFTCLRLCYNHKLLKIVRLFTVFWVFY